MDYVVEKQRTTCGSAELESKKYKKIVGRNLVWYVAVQENEADNVYCTSKNKARGSDGFGGRTLVFELEDGTRDSVQGPWHSSSGSLFEDAGYDARDKHLTFGVVAMDSGHDEHWNTVMVDVQHRDEAPVLGKFDRIDELAQETADRLQKTVAYYRESKGGSCRSSKEPKKS